jgi:hypothetical protein
MRPYPTLATGVTAHGRWIGLRGVPVEVLVLRAATGSTHSFSAIWIECDLSLSEGRRFCEQLRCSATILLQLLHDGNGVSAGLHGVHPYSPHPSHC